MAETISIVPLSLSFLRKYCECRLKNPGGEWTGWGWRNEEGSWFHKKGDAYLKERLVIYNKEDTDGRARVRAVEIHCRLAERILVLMQQVRESAWALLRAGLIVQ